MPRYLAYVFKLAAREKRLLITLAGLLVASVFARLLEPYLYKVIVDSLTAGLQSGVYDHRALIGSVVLWFLLAILLNLASAEASHRAWIIGNYSSNEVHRIGYERLLRMDYREHAATHSSKLVKAVDDADVAAWEMTLWWLNRFASAILGFFGMLVIALSVSWPMTLIALSVIPVGLGMVVRQSIRTQQEQKNINKLWEEKYEHLSDQVSNIVTFKLNPHECVYTEKHDALARRAQDAQLELNKKWRSIQRWNPDAFARFLVLGAGIFLVQDGSITLGTLFMFMGLLSEILTPLHVLEDILPQYHRRAQHLERFLDMLAKKDKVTDPARPMSVGEIRGDVEFQGVHFSHRGKAKKSFRLSDVSFRIRPGETLALVGHSGSGKTTIMQLLSRLMDPDRGKILIDGRDIRRFRQEDIKRHIGAVLQENAMYNETVAENIGYGDPAASRERIILAARQAHAHEFIERLPKGYDSLIGERGVRLSGGEKQRIAIARAILKDPRIVILDEPTSALDSITEHKVQQGLDELMKGRTTLIIAHRLSTVRHSNTILVLEKGRIIAQGTHEELVASCPTYRRMVELQIGGFLADE